MDPIRQKLTQVMCNAARQALEKLDPESSIAGLLRKAHYETALEDDIRRIVEAMSLLDIAATLGMASQIGRKLPTGKLTKIKQDLKKIAEKAAAKAESKGGKLKIPDECRQLIMSL